MIRRTCLALVLSLAFAAPLLAQERAAVSAGDRVRVTSSSIPRTNGIVLETQPDTLVLRSRGETIYTAWADVRTLHIAEPGSRGRSAFKYGRIGLIAGAATGAAFGLAAFSGNDSADGPCLLCSPGIAAVYLGGRLGVTGAVLGSLAGAAFPEERWRPVKAPVTVSAGPAAAGGVALQARLRF